ncbi:MAG TPA: hypothetical protein VF681_15785 [Abditibacteriaceae bacterium]
MKRHFVSTVLLASVVCCPPLLAQEKPAEPTMASSAIRLPATAWDKSGLLSPEEIVAALGIKPTPEQMTIISLAASERNLAVSQANQALAAALQKTLGSSDAELAAKLAEEKERRRMEIMRIRQPSRYQALKNKKK